MAIKIDHPNNTLSPQEGLLIIKGSAGLSLPFGISADRPIAPLEGTIRFNEVNSRIEYYADGDWSTVVQYAPNSRELEKYELEFNATGDWINETTVYSISISATTHIRGFNPTIQIFELVSGTYDLVTVDRLSISSTGDIKFTVPATPDLRFAGKVVIL